MGKTDLENFFNGILNKAKQIDGKIVGENMDFIEAKMAKDSKGAWVNHLTEQYLKKETLDIPPSDLNIIEKDVINEIAKREFDKILGK